LKDKILAKVAAEFLVNLGTLEGQLLPHFEVKFFWFRFSEMKFHEMS
jgi:hypothetical protein